MTMHDQPPRLLRYLLFVAMALGGAATTLYAPPAAAQKDMDRAREAFKKGKSLYEEEKYEAAVDAFKEAYKYSNRSELLYNIGQAYRRSGELQKAETYFQRYLDENPEAPNRQEVLDDVVEIQQKLAAQMGSVEVTTEQTGASVFVDDEKKPRCSTPCTVSLEPGPHQIRAESEGKKLGSKSVAVSKGSTDKIALGGSAPTGPPGGLHIRTDGGGGSVAVAGAGEASLPMSKPMELPPGQHQMTVTGSSGGTWKGDITIESGETKRLFVSTAPTSSGGGSGGPSVKRSVAYGLAGASLALIGGGLLLGQNAKSTHEILSNQQSQQGAVDPKLLEKGRREQTTANILIGSGAATLLSGAGLFTWDLLGSGGN